MFTPVDADCGGQGPRVVGRGLVIQDRVRSLGLVVGGLGGDNDPRMGQVEPPRVYRGVQLLSRMEHHEHGDEQVFPGTARASGSHGSGQSRTT